MSKIVVVISNGFEEIETVSIIDVCRRAEIKVIVAAVENLTSTGANDIKLIADCKIEEIETNDFDMIVLPGGLPNAFTLASDENVQRLLKEFKQKDKYISAICAAPYALHEAKVLNNKYTCYPSFEKKIDSAKHIPNETIVRDEKVLTSQGPATAMQFALEIVKTLKGEEVYNNIKSALLVSHF